MGTPLSDHVTTGPIEGSTKHYVDVDGLQVPQRRINLTNGEHLDVYDTSGPYTDSTAVIDVEAGLARTRDELLPLLMSGRITVGEAEEAAGVAGTAASES